MFLIEKMAIRLNDRGIECSIERSENNTSEPLIITNKTLSPEEKNEIITKYKQFCEIAKS